MITESDITIRQADAADAEAISSLILAALRQTNAQDYPAAVIEGLARSFGTARVAVMVRQREMFVAEQLGLVVGTIGYAAGCVRSLFVAPNYQAKGIGQELIATVEKIARQAHVRSLTVAASLTAVAFYHRCGFVDLRPVSPSGINMMLMHKLLIDAAEDSDGVDW